MKLREIFRYEVEHRLRSPSTWIYAAFLFLIAFAMIHIDADGSSADPRERARRASRLLAIMAGMVGHAGLGGDLRRRGDSRHEAGMDPLLFTSPIRKIDYLGGRFLGALDDQRRRSAGHSDRSRCRDDDAVSARVRQFGPFVGGAFVQTYLLFLLPNLVLTGAILFTVAALTRQAVPVYLAAIAVFVGYVVAVNLPPGNAATNLLTDPLGVRVLNRRDRALDADRAEHAPARVVGDAADESCGLARDRGGGSRAALSRLPICARRSGRSLSSRSCHAAAKRVDLLCPPTEKQVLRSLTLASG